jgi:dTDP-4-amino-4,6-dideoxygalactose transaminase
MQAALLQVKLRHLDALTAHKRRLADIYFDSLPKNVISPSRRGDEYDVFHIFPVRHPRRDALRGHLLAHGIKTEIHYPVPPHRQEAMRGILAGEYPLADEVHATELSLPISFAHAPEDILAVCKAIGTFSS